jgi:hypothetical protein
LLGVLRKIEGGATATAAVHDGPTQIALDKTKLDLRRSRQGRYAAAMGRMMVAFLLISLTPAWPAGAQARSDRVPVLAELFTSEGCSSCPPADRILELLASEPPVDGVDVIIMSEHVTYWDHQGWRDPFGSTTFTSRQQKYGEWFKLESVFTPQLVIDGASQLVGTDIAGLKAALAKSVTKPKPRLTVAVRENGPQGLVATASGPAVAGGASTDLELVWAVTEDNLEVEVKRGENARRTLHHSGVVRWFSTKKFGDGAMPASIDIPLRPEWKRDRLRVVAFVQSARTRDVLSVGAASVQTRPPRDTPR